MLKRDWSSFWLGWHAGSYLTLGGLFAASLLLSALHAEEPGAQAATGKAKPLAELECREVCESSGLASSRREPGLLWTHNDSGGKPCLYAFDETGQHLGKVLVKGAKSSDWEDMVSYQTDNETWLLVADTGDNKAERKSYQLYILKEPDKAAENVEVAEVIEFTFEGGSFDCESVAVDTATKQILLVTKEWALKCKVFALPLPDVDRVSADPPDENGDATTELEAAKRESPQSPLVAKQICELLLPGVTALDISADGSRAVAMTYASAFEYARAPQETWKQAFKRSGKEIPLPSRKQSEAICYSADGKALYCTSEACPTPLYRVELDALSTAETANADGVDAAEAAADRGPKADSPDE